MSKASDASAKRLSAAATPVAGRTRPSATSTPSRRPAGSTALRTTASATAARTTPGARKTAQIEGEAQEKAGTAPNYVASKQRRIGFEWLNAASDSESDGQDSRAIIWLDIDNTLYKKSTKIAELMGERIRAYFTGMGLEEAEAERLHTRYYKEYGLAIRGLVKHHKIDPLDYDAKCDASLPLENIIHPDRAIQQLLADLDRTKCRVFGLTNAYKYHARRVLRLLGLEAFVEGLVYCDYQINDFACKPEADFYLQAMEAIGVSDPRKCHFVDDSALNVRAAKDLGWGSCVLFDEIAAPPSTADEKAAVCSFSASVLLPRANTSGQSISKHVNGSAPATSGGLMIPTSEGDFDGAAIQQEFRKLPHSMRIRLMNLLLDACMPGDLAALSRSLERYLRMTRDIISTMPDSISLRVFEKLEVKELLRCRRVSRKWSAIAADPALWRSHALALTEGDPVPITPPQDEAQWEELVKGLYFRERNWTKGLAQRLDFFEGHTGFVTSIKLKGRHTLVTGSYDETIRVWDLRTGHCQKVLKAKAISCLDFLLDQNVLCAGLYDTGRVMVWDMKTWELTQTLSGHNRGIRNIALNEDYLVSVGQDKAIVVWDWRSGNKIVRFGQQTNVSLGVSIVDGDKIVAVTVDGLIRTFSIPAAKMIAQFDLHKLGGKDSQLNAKLSTLGGSAAMLQWFAASGNTMTIASKDLVVHLQWREHIVAVEPKVKPSEIRPSASSRSLGTPTPSRVRRESLQGVRTPTSSLTPSTNGTPRTRRDSTASTASVMSTATLSGRRSVSGGHARSISSATNGGVTPIRTASSSSSLSSAGRCGLSSARSPSTASLTALPSSIKSPTSPSVPALSPLMPISASGSFETSTTPPTPSSGATRYAPNLAAPPTLVEILKTPDMATGCVDPAKRRIVCSTFSSRAGSDRRLFSSTHSIEKGNLPEDGTSSGLDSAATHDGDTLKIEEKTGFVAVGGAWKERKQELQAPSTRPLALIVDHESIVAGCQDGTVYRLGFIGSKYRTIHDEPPSADDDGRKKVDGADVVIEDLTELREVWKDVMLPKGAPADHPGRIKVDALKTIGLK